MSAKRMVSSFSKWILRSCVVSTLGMVLVLGCSSDKPVVTDNNHVCTFNSDCSDGLVCSFGLCHAECHESSDCPANQRCVKAVKSEGDAAAVETTVCQLPSEAKCSLNSQCDDPLICAVDLQ